MLEPVSKNGTPMIMFHIDGDYGYCKKSDGTIVKELLTGLKTNPLYIKDASNGWTYLAPAGTPVYQHMRVSNIIETQA